MSKERLIPGLDVVSYRGKKITTETWLNLLHHNLARGTIKIDHLKTQRAKVEYIKKNTDFKSIKSVLGVPFNELDKGYKNVDQACLRVFGDGMVNFAKLGLALEAPLTPNSIFLTERSVPYGCLVQAEIFNFLPDKHRPLLPLFKQWLSSSASEKDSTIAFYSFIRDAIGYKHTAMLFTSASGRSNSHANQWQVAALLFNSYFKTNMFQTNIQFRHHLKDYKRPEVSKNAWLWK